MNRPNFFCSIEALQKLLGMKLDGYEPNVELTMDLIEAPYLFIYTVEKDAWGLKVLSRGEMYDHTNGSGIELANLCAERSTGQATGTCSDRALSQNIGAFLHGCQQLSRYLQAKKLQPLCKDMDPEQAGILLEMKNGALNARKVAGQERPEMMCTTLFGGTVMCRPYMEDFWDRSETEMMSLEDRIEKAEGGDKFAIATLAQAYLNGDDEVEQDPEKAAYWYRKEAELQDSEGAFNLGLLYAKGFGVERDFKQAAEWMEKAVAWGDPDGTELAKLYRGMTENQRKAEAGESAAMAELAEGYMALGGSLDQAGPKEDYMQSQYWAQKAVDAGCGAGYWPLALAYRHGRGVTKNEAKAVEFFRKGAESGNAPCQHSYGCCLMTGEGAKKDVKQALSLFEKSAEQGYALACRDLGRMYETGEGVEPDFDKELAYYEKACEANPNDGEFLRHVGFQYTNLLDEKDKWLHGVERAAYWLRKASDAGDRTAARGADMYERILALHKQGIIPLGASVSECMGYLSGERSNSDQSDTDAKREAEAKRKAEAEAKRKAEEERKRKAEEERKRKAEEERKKREEARRKAEEEKRRKEEQRKKAKEEYNAKYGAVLKQKAELENKRQSIDAQISSKRSENVATKGSSFAFVLGFVLLLTGIVILFSANGSEKLAGLLFGIPGALIFFIIISKGISRSRAIADLMQEKTDTEKKIADLGPIPTEDEFIRQHTK